MTKYTDDADNHFNTFISSSIKELTTNRLCYVYTDEQVEIIKKAIYNKLNKNVTVKDNGCGYTLTLNESK